MSSLLPNPGQSKNGARHTMRQDVASCSSVVASKVKSMPDRARVPTLPAIKSTSHSPSETPKKTILGVGREGGVVENVFSVTLHDELPWRDIDLGKYIQGLSSPGPPTWLQGAADMSPYRLSLGGKNNEAYKDVNDSGGSVPRYSAAQKGKWKVPETDGDVKHESCGSRTPSPQFHFDTAENSVEDWVSHTRPILQDYANRQTSLPLGQRLQVSIDEPPKFILGATHLLVNRDRKGCTDRSRQLGPQLIENFVDIDVWAKEYFRSRHGTQVMDSDVPALLTIVLNNFYEGQVQLIDRLVELALKNMRFRGSRNLAVEDFAFGFDFKMSQDLPFYVETSSRIRKPLPIRAVEVQPTSTPAMTSSGRQIKLTERAKLASEQAQSNASGRRNKGKNTSPVKVTSPPRARGRPACQGRNPAQSKSSAQGTTQETSQPSQAENQVTSPPKTGTAKHRPVRPSNLGLPPVSSSTAGTLSSRLDENSSVTATAESLKASGSSGPNDVVDPPPRLTILVPSLKKLTLAAPTSSSGSTTRAANSSTTKVNSPTKASTTRPARSGGTRGPRGCGRTSEKEGAGDLDIVPGNSKGLSTAPPATVGGAKTFTKADKPVASPSTQIRAFRSTVGTSRSRPQGTNNGIVSRDGGPSTPRSRRAKQPLQTPSELVRPQGKKRKLDDWEE